MTDHLKPCNQKYSPAFFKNILISDPFNVKNKK